MTGPSRRRAFTTTSLLFLLPLACSENCHIGRNNPPAAGTGAIDTSAQGAVSGVPVKREVPHSKESASEIMDRESKEPLSPRGDVAIPSHRILPVDNGAIPNPSGRGAKDGGSPSGPPPTGSGGAR